MDGLINFKLDGNYRSWGETREALSRSFTGQTDHKIKIRRTLCLSNGTNHLKTSSNRRNIVLCKEIGVVESNSAAAVVFRHLNGCPSSFSRVDHAAKGWRLPLRLYAMLKLTFSNPHPSS